MVDFIMTGVTATRSLGLALPSDDGTWTRFFLPGSSAKGDVDQAKSGVLGQLINGPTYNTRGPWSVQGLDDHANGNTGMAGGYELGIPPAQAPKPPATLMLVAKGPKPGLGNWYNDSTAMSTVVMQATGGRLYAQSSTGGQNGASLALPAGYDAAWGIYLATFDWHAGGRATQAVYYSDLAGNVLSASNDEPAVAQTGALNYPLNTNHLLDLNNTPWSFALAAVRARALSDGEARAHLAWARRYFAGRLV